MWYSITLIIGIVLALVSLFFFKKSLDFLKASNRAIATVVELQEISDSEGRSYKPVFEFKTVTNQVVRFMNATPSNPPAWYIGEETTIAYDSNDPAKAKVMTYFGTFNVSIVLLSIAMPLIVIGGGYFATKIFLR